MLDDTEKRLNALFDELNNETVSESVVESLLQFSQGKHLLLQRVSYIHSYNHDSCLIGQLYVSATTQLPLISK